MRPLQDSGTSRGEIFSPPRLMSSLMRPVSVRKPSSSRKPWSPVWNHPPAKACGATRTSLLGPVTGGTRKVVLIDAGAERSAGGMVAETLRLHSQWLLQLLQSLEITRPNQSVVLSATLLQAGTESPHSDSTRKLMPRVT